MDKSKATNVFQNQADDISVCPQGNRFSIMKGKRMDVGQVTMNTSMAMIIRQLQGMAEMQMAVMKEMADSQQQIAGLLQSAGIGQNIDVMA